MSQLIPLHCLNDGETARVDQVLGQTDVVHRLSELGLRSGVLIEMVRSGSPCIIRLGGHKLCFRADEITSVLVTPGAMA